MDYGQRGRILSLEKEIMNQYMLRSEAFKPGMTTRTCNQKMGEFLYIQSLQKSSVETATIKGRFQSWHLIVQDETHFCTSQDQVSRGRWQKINKALVTSIV